MRTRVAVGGFVLVAAVLGWAVPASAHVGVSPAEVPKGGFEKLTFTVPNERDDAGTTSLEVNMPTDTLLEFVFVQPLAGWTADVTRRTLDEPVEGEYGPITEVVEKVTWSGGTINPGEFQEFSIEAGPFPDDAETLEFPSIQTYSSGEEVAWIQETPEGGEEPELPVPVLTLIDGEAEGDEHGGSGEGDAEEAVATEDGDANGSAASTSDDSDDSNGLAVVALVVGGVGVLLGGLALIRRRTV